MENKINIKIDIPKIGLPVQPKFWFTDRVYIGEDDDLCIGHICGMNCTASDDVLAEGCYFYWEYRIQFFDSDCWCTEEELISYGNKPTTKISG